MKIELLYVAGCPHLPAALSRLTEVLSSYGLTERIEQIEVRDPAMARQLDFCGSPTIRIDGRDIEGERERPCVVAMACRLYPDSQDAEIPPVALIRRALQRAFDQGGN